MSNKRKVAEPSGIRDAQEGNNQKSVSSWKGKRKTMNRLSLKDKTPSGYGKKIPLVLRGRCSAEQRNVTAYQ